jgi:hypothetical protein
MRYRCCITFDLHEIVEKVKAYMTVNGAPDRSPTFTET